MFETKRKRLFSWSVVAAIVAVLAVLSCGGKQPHGQSQVVDTIPEMVLQIKKCSKLYTTECKIHKIVTHDDQVAVKGKIFNRDYNINLPLGQRKVAISIDATVKAYVDFSTFSRDNVRKKVTR